MRICLLLVCFSMLPLCFYGQTDTLRVNFLYGSKPTKASKETESKLFGGIKGGHVNLEVKGMVLDFMPGKNPLLPDKKNPTGAYRISSSVYWDTASDKWLTIYVPLTVQQTQQFSVLADSFARKTPYDYSIFGMRCAAASYDVLSELGFFRQMPDSKNIRKHFYPKLLRKKMIKWARKNNFEMSSHNGRPTRKWEKDKGLL